MDIPEDLLSIFCDPLLEHIYLLLSCIRLFTTPLGNIYLLLSCICLFTTPLGNNHLLLSFIRLFTTPLRKYLSFAILYPSELHKVPGQDPPKK